MDRFLPGIFSLELRPFYRWNVVLGSVAWLAFVGFIQPGWAVTLFLLAPLALVPLALALLEALGRGTDVPRLWRTLTLLQFPAAGSLLGAFALPAGLPAAAGAVPWLGLTGLVALAGLRHLASRTRKTAPCDYCIDLGMIYLPVGAAWAVLARLGARPLGFSDVIVLATAVHFHYAGFVLPLLAGLAGRALPGRTARLAASGVVVGVPMVALGITLSAFAVRWPEWLAAWALAAACCLTAGLQAGLAFRVFRGPSRWLLTISSLALLGGMALAAVYALGTFCGTPWLTIEDMVPLHGAVNAFGFALCGLIGWNLALAEPPAAATAPMARGNGVPQHSSRRANILRLEC